MNGWKNYQTWNVTLWIGNDETLYALASGCLSYAEFCTALSAIGTLENGDIPLARETPDGVSWNDPQLDLQAIAEWWNDTFLWPGHKLWNLRRYSDGSYIRPATEVERRASIGAGAEGVIPVMINGERVACYVED